MEGQSPYFTILQFCERNPAFPAGGLRSQIFNEFENGLHECGAIVRNGRRVLINEEKFFLWLESQNKKLLKQRRNTKLLKQRRIGQKPE